ncbi:MAG: FlgD immunoglobulin-like domain containing protein [Candidatus Krumholzibacteria bacterium]|jgi:hypothetical protein|nr:FlgD immunoglobulin-like domain containing protein [Candidatus Krumholzibacteria bacterium]MDP6798146.1 FlgD immunoglobulin-like domain containing protein [Candidatus Krumholzibacteria bacterium]MDP7022007.1 FlgD immunoglobulin-like domain containing protein [Candidatus Krumholzibacteria bacterium]
MKSRYDRVEFDAVRLMQTSGGLGSPDADDRCNYYGMGGIPDCVFGGVDHVVGGGTTTATGATYDPLVLGILDDSSPIALKITNFNFSGSPSVSIQVDVVDDIADISNTFVRLYVVENNLVYGSTTYTDVLRDMLQDTALTVSQDGESQTFTQDFAVNPDWKLDDLRIVAFVQRDSDGYIYQSTTSYPQPDYSFRFYTLGDRVVVGQSGSWSSGDFAVFNTGTLQDDYHIEFDTSSLPVGWSGWFTDGENQFASLDITLPPGASASFHVVLDVVDLGFGSATMSITSATGGTTRDFSYTYLTEGLDVLVVDDDGSESYEDYFTAALETTVRSYGVWDRNSTPVSAEILSHFDAVIWNVGWAFPTFTPEDREALTGYLESGGALFASGQDIGWELHDQGGAAYTWYRETLHATYVADDTNDYTLQGVAGDEISDGIDLTIIGGDGANNQQYPSDIDPYGNGSSAIFTYNSYRNAAVKADDGYRVVYFAFGYEAINNATDRAQVMQRIINWLIPDMTSTPDVPLAVKLHQNHPNPFNPKTEIRFSLSDPVAASLVVYDVEGREIRVLRNGQQEAGQQIVSWDGRDESGQRVSSGLYFYRLQTADRNETRKMLLLK